MLIVHSLFNLKTAPVLILHTEAKVLLLSHNGTVVSDWSSISCMLITSGKMVWLDLTINLSNFGFDQLAYIIHYPIGQIQIIVVFLTSS